MTRVFKICSVTCLLYTMVSKTILSRYPITYRWTCVYCRQYTQDPLLTRRRVGHPLAFHIYLRLQPHGSVIMPSTIKLERGNTGTSMECTKSQPMHTIENTSINKILLHSTSTYHFHMTLNRFPW